MGEFLAVQWLGLAAFTDVAQGQSLVVELGSHKRHSAAKKQTNKQTKTAWMEEQSTKLQAHVPASLS